MEDVEAAVGEDDFFSLSLQPVDFRFEFIL
jgi:hypothetical protein